MALQFHRKPSNTFVIFGSIEKILIFNLLAIINFI